MGRVAASVWALAGAVVALGALWAIPMWIRAFADAQPGLAPGRSDYGANIAMCFVGLALAALALRAAAGAWRGERRWGLAFPAVVVACGGIAASFEPRIGLLDGLAYALTPLGAVFLLPGGVVMALIVLAFVWLADASFGED